MATEHTGLPVAGYRPQSSAAVDLVNANKALEESVLRCLDAIEGAPNVDQSWLFEGRRKIEIGMMCVNRAIFKPARVALPDDLAP